MSETWQLAWRELRRRKRRSAANVIGYGLAIAVLVVLVSALDYSRAATDKILGSTGTHFVAFSPPGGPPVSCCPQTGGPALALPSAAFPGSGGAQQDQAQEPPAPLDDREAFVALGVPTRLLDPQAVQQVDQLPTVAHAAPFLMYRLAHEDGALFTVGGFDPADANVVGTTCCAPSDIIAGRFLTAQDRGQVMLEEAYALTRGLQVGSTVTLSGEAFTVVGIVNPGIRPAKADIYMLLPEARWVVSARLAEPLGQQANQILVEVTDSRVQEDAIAAVKRMGLSVSTYACYAPAARVMGMNQAAVWVLTLVIALGAGALALRSETATVLERRRDIGILRALGWSDRRVVSQIMAEALLQAFLGALLGLALAALALWFVSPQAITGLEEAQGQVTIPPVWIGGALLIALAAGAVAGLVPATLTARRRPAESLREL